MPPSAPSFSSPPTPSSLLNMATPSTFELPTPLRSALSRLPRFPGSVLLVTALNVTLRPQLPGDTRAALLHKCLRVTVRDAALTFDFTWTGSHFAPSPTHAQADLVITANASDFLQLARRQIDPDTLFFNRRLSMEGDTELGLVVKNAIDAMELPVLDPQHWTPLAVFARVARGRNMSAPSPRRGGW